MIGYVLGAPGAGKSAAVLPLRELLPARVVLDWDAFLVPAGLLAGADIRQTPSTWDRYGQLVKIVAGHLSPLPIILMTPCTPDELSDWPTGRWLLLDCTDEERRLRLQERDDPARIQSALVDANSYRSIGLPTLDSTGLAPAAVARLLADWIGHADG